MEAKLVQFKANEKVLSGKDLTALGEKVQNLCLNDDLLENLSERSKEIYNNLFLFTEEASYTVFIKKINLEDFNDGHMEAIKKSRKMKTSKLS